MATDLKVTVDLGKLNTVINSINEKAVKKAVRASIIRTFTSMKAAVTKEIRAGKFFDQKKLPADKMKRRYFKEQKNLGSNVDLTDLSASLSIYSKRLDLINFFAKRVQTGVRPRPTRVPLKSGKWVTLKAGSPMYGAQVKIYGRQRIYNGDFIGNIGKPSEQVFRRKSDGSIFKRTGPTIPEMFKKTGAAERIQKEADARMQRELDHQLDYYFSKI